MADGTIVLQLSSGPVFVGPRSFNYNKIRRALPLPEDRLLPLLEPPELPNGIFYLHHYNDSLAVVQLTDNYTKHFVLTNNKFQEVVSLQQDNGPIAGIYADMDDIANDFPEYFI